MEHFKSAIIFCCAFIPSFTFLKLCLGLESLIPNQTLVIGQTLISPNQMFEMGFFSPGSSKNRFLGIWYKCTPDVVVWVANRNNPITELQGVHLAIVGNKSLTVKSARGIIWSSNYTWVALNPVLQLLNTGNLVLVDKAYDNLLQRYIWQSFDHPTDTLLPGMNMVDDVDASVERYLTSWRNSEDPSCGDFVVKMQNIGLPDSVLFKGIKKIYRSGTWNGLYFSGNSPFLLQIMKTNMVFKEEKMISSSLPYNNSTFRRITVHNSGYLQNLVLNARKDDWNPVSVHPQDPCEEYNKCGPFGICTLDILLRCQCFKGFAPKYQKDWDSQDWSGGCTRVTELNCQSQDHGFLEITGTNYPDMLQFWLNTSMSLTECEVACLKNCRCIAYANPYITNGGSGCVMWFGELIDTKYVPLANNKQKIYIRLPLSELDFHTNSEQGEKKNRPSMFVLIPIAILVYCFIVAGIYFMAGQMKRGTSEEKLHEDFAISLFKLSTIVNATNNFSKENLIGEGGFGSVHMVTPNVSICVMEEKEKLSCNFDSKDVNHVSQGYIHTKGEIAVKRLSAKSEQGIDEFKNEVMLIAKLQHRNLVKRLGYCIERGERMLIYEYLQNKSLDTFLFDQDRHTLLTWPIRFDIIMGIARGMLYLHHDSRLKVIHRDLKTNNILLDGNLNPKISDFGIARIFEEGQSTLSTKRVVGTYGYMSPEYVIAGKFSTKSDIFSLGVVLLEIISGKKNRSSVNCNQYYSLLRHAWVLWKENKTLELIDECLKYTLIESQVKRCVHVGLLCVQKDLVARPDMISVNSMLATEEAILSEPMEPGFFMERHSSATRSYTSAAAKSNNGTMTITNLEAR